MRLHVGSFTHRDNEVWLHPIVDRRVPGPRGRTAYINHRWGVHGVLIGTSAADLTTKIEAYTAAYRNIDGDVIFRDNDGAATAHKILASETLNGIRGSISFPGPFRPPGGQAWGSGAEYVYTRYIVGQIEADTIAMEDNILLYHQTMQFSLGGFGYKVLEAFMGPPQVQLTKQQSKFWAVQRGTAVGAFINPNPADPLLPVPVDPERSWVRTATPQIQGTLRNLAFETSWLYYYESPFPLNAIPPPNP